MIKGVEMPNCCAECDFNHEAECYPCNRLVCDKPYESRGDWCPLVDADIYIAKIESDLEDCRNELCLYCGDYKMRHKGACDGCRWYK